MVKTATKLPALTSIDPGVFVHEAIRPVDAARPYPPEDRRWMDRLWIMPDGRPTLRKPIVRPSFDGPSGPVLGSPTDLTELESDAERDVLHEDTLRDAPGYFEPAKWCYLRWASAPLIDALKQHLMHHAIDYAMVVACDLARQVDEGTRKKGRADTIRRIAKGTDEKFVFPWHKIKAALAGVGVEVFKYPVVLGERALGIVRK